MKNLILLYYLFKHNIVLGIVSSKTPQISHSISTCPIYNSLISLIYEQRQNKISDMITCGVWLKIYTNCAVKIDVFCPKSVQDRPSKIQTRSYCLEFRLAKIGGRPTKFISEATEAVFAQRRRQITRQPGWVELLSRAARNLPSKGEFRPAKFDNKNQFFQLCFGLL